MNGKKARWIGNDMFGLVSQKKKDQIVLDERIAQFFYAFYVHSIPLSSKTGKEAYTENLISLVEYIADTSLGRAGYLSEELTKDQAMLLMIAVFVISDALLYWLPAPNRDISPELISSVVSMATNLPEFGMEAGSIYAEAMKIYNHMASQKLPVTKVFVRMGQAAMSFLENNANENELEPISEGLRLLIEHGEFKS